MPPLAYYWIQLRQAFAKRAKRPHPFAELVVASTALPYDTRILCLGARNRQEPDAWRRLGYHRVTAIDLLPGPGLMPMDFHRLRFPADSYGLLYAAHAFEHAYDMAQAAREAVRVLRVGGYLFAAFPVAFTPSGHDRYDFGSADGFLKHFAFARLTRLWHRQTPTEVAVLARLEAK